MDDQAQLGGAPSRAFPVSRFASGGCSTKEPRSDGSLIFGQKQVDLLLGLGIVLLSGKQQITHATLVAGDGDLVSAVELAKREGVSLWLFHGPSVAADNQTGTYSRELWQAADGRREIDRAFWDRVRHQF